MPDQRNAMLDAPLRPNARVTVKQAVRLSYNFASGLPLAQSADLTGLSRKTVREMSGEFREYLLRPEFNGWHRSNTLLVRITDPEQEALIRATFFDVLSDCHANETCYRNHRLGNRKTRLCRSCSIPTKYRHGESVTAAVEAIDAVRRFYEGLGWRGETRDDPVLLFRRRFIHAAAVATAREHTRFLPGGAPDPRDGQFLSVNVLARKLLEAAVS